MGFIIGFVMGYWLGMSSEPLDIQEISKAWGEIRRSDGFQAALANGSDLARKFVESGAAEVVAEVASAASSQLTLWQRTRLFLFGKT